MTKEQLKKLQQQGYTAIIRRSQGSMFLPIKGNDETIADSANVTPLKEDEILFLDEALQMDDEQLRLIGEIKTPLRRA